jgi:hypothetical protein
MLFLELRGVDMLLVGLLDMIADEFWYSSQRLPQFGPGCY